jgi:type II secretory pathway component PulC
MSLMRASFLSTALSALVFLACGGEDATRGSAAKSPSGGSAKGAAAEGSSGPARPVTSLRRAQIRAAVAAGLGSLLQNVTFEDMPSMTNGKFHGFVIQSINPELGVDLRPGDVITRVNGIVPEQPDDADAALRSLEKAAALKVEFEREGKPRTLELPIVD